MNQYLFFYLHGVYGATYAKGKGKTLKQGLKDAFAKHYSHGIGGKEPSKWHRKNFLRESILISTFTEEGEIIENDSSIELLHAALNPLLNKP
jgi:hypothetical protein